MPDIPKIDLIEQFGPWLVLGGIAVAFFIRQAPTIKNLINDFLPLHRQYSREKMRLELLKLHYEIESIRKTNDLEDLSAQLPNSLNVAPLAADVEAGGKGANAATSDDEKPKKIGFLFTLRNGVLPSTLAGFAVALPIAGLLIVALAAASSEYARFEAFIIILVMLTFFFTGFGVATTDEDDLPRGFSDWFWSRVQRNVGTIVFIVVIVALVKSCGSS